MSVTTNMNITLPTPGSDDGTWGDAVNAGLEVIDEHDHSPGKGVPVPSTGFEVVSDIDMGSSALLNANEVTLTDQSAALTGNSHKRSVNAVNGDLYYTNSSGVAVQLTSGNSLAAAPVSGATPPTASVVDYAGLTAPAGWVLCNGTVYDGTDATYADLYAILGTTWNTGGESANHFRVPNLIGRTTIMAGTYTDTVSGSVTRTYAASGGAEKHVLTTNQMPSHSHNVTDPGHVHTSNALYAPAGGVIAAISGGSADFSATTNSATTGISIQNTGGGQSHNIMQPYTVLNKIIKL